MEWGQIISLVLNLVLGSGFLVTFVTLKATKKKAEAEAKTSELDNVQEAVKIWREMAENLKAELDNNRSNQKDMVSQIETLRNEVQRLTAINNKIVLLLNKITPDNLDLMIEQIKTIHCSPVCQTSQQ